MQEAHPHIISIAGYDPCGGAGIIADIKTCEAFGVYAYGVITANTIQNEDEFKETYWTDINVILSQIEILFSKYNIEWVKIGIVSGLPMLEKIIGFIHKKNPSAKIIWDPILKSSSGYSFIDKYYLNEFYQIFPKIFLLTPNLFEANKLFPELTNIKEGNKYSLPCNVLIKGGHDKIHANDILIAGKETSILESEKIENAAKHGSGCVLASAITASLAKGKQLKESCIIAKEYVREFLLSNSGLLGNHNYINYK